MLLLIQFISIPFTFFTMHFLAIKIFIFSVRILLSFFFLYPPLKENIENEILEIFKNQISFSYFGVPTYALVHLMHSYFAYICESNKIVKFEGKSKAKLN